MVSLRCIENYKIFDSGPRRKLRGLGPMRWLVHECRLGFLRNHRIITETQRGRVDEEICSAYFKQGWYRENISRPLRIIYLCLEDGDFFCSF